MTADPWGGTATPQQDPWGAPPPPPDPQQQWGGEPQRSTAPPNLDDLWGGQSVKSFHFGTGDAPPGITHGGQIVALPAAQQEMDYYTKEPKTWDNGEPKWLIPIHIQADYLKEGDDDDGVRAFYLKYKQLDAAKEAVHKATGRTQPEVGGHLYLEYCGRQGRTKLYRGVYSPPGATPPPVEVTRITGSPQQPAPPAQAWGGAPTAAPAPAPQQDPWHGLNAAAAAELSAKGYLPEHVLPVIKPLPNWQAAPAAAIINKVGPPRSEEPPF